MLESALLKKILVDQNVFTQAEMTEHDRQAQQRNIDLETYLVSQHAATTEQIYRAIADYFKYPFISLNSTTLRRDILGLIPEAIALEHRVVAFEKKDKSLSIATALPNHTHVFDFIEKKIGLPVTIHIATPNNITEVIKLYHPGLKEEFEDFVSNSNEQPNGQGQNLQELARDIPVIRIVDTLLEYAVIENASDIHIEPLEREITVRYRIDGILKNVMTLPKSLLAGVVARIKIMSDLKLDEHRLPQDGRFKEFITDHDVSFRVSIIPTYDGEKIVLRLLDEKNSLLNLDQLGLQPSALAVVQRNIDKPHGLILVTGPTGSGKTTTLYAILNILNDPSVNITTIEDPIEYRMPGVNQSQVNPKIGYTFAIGLRAYLRQDPDIIMVGEIRDDETAEIAIHAALTGHLVLSTLHTNDAPTTLPRLSEMGVPAFLVASSTNVIIAQRLVRKVCQECKEQYTISADELTQLKQIIDLDALLTMLVREKVHNDKQTAENLILYRGKGCKKCNQTGYKGRIGIYEAMEVTHEISELINQSKGALAIRDAAKKDGMITIFEDGFIKVSNGITTLEEVLRVTKE